MTVKIAKKHKICRALGINLWGSPDSTFIKRPTRPGQHGKNKKRKLSTYGLRLKEKQKIKFFYGMKENQFLNLFKEAYKSSDCVNYLFGNLERRLDSVCFRNKFASSIFAAKQLVTHKHILVNGKTVNLPSYRVKPGDVIEIKNSMKNNSKVLLSQELKHSEIPAYSEKIDNSKIIFSKVPTFTEIKYPFQVKSSLIIELYSKNL